MGKSNLYLLQFNQYYNKQVKVFSTLKEYEPYVVYSSEEYKLTNNAFNPRDGIDTSIVVNTPSANYDYLLLVDEDGDIESRWFVTQANYERGNGITVSAQYTLSLHRDLMADYYDEVVNATTYIEKASLPISNPLIYNSEGMSFNQIKSAEIPLKDISNCGWVVAYIARNYANDTAQTITTYSRNQVTEFSYSRNELASQVNQQSLLFGELNDLVLSFEGNYSGNFTERINSNNTHNGIPSGDVNIRFDFETQIETGLNKLTQEFSKIDKTPFIQDFYSYSTTPNQQTILNTLLPMSGKLVKNTDDGTFFTFDLKPAGTRTVLIKLPVNSGLYNQMSNFLGTLKEVFLESGTYNYYMTATVPAYQITRVETVTGTPISLIIPRATVRQALIDAPYDLFCMPYGTSKLLYKVEGSTGLKLLEAKSLDYVLNMAQQLATDLGGDKGFLYDIQLLPYCPCLEYMRNETFYFDELPGTHYSLIMENDIPVSFGLWAQKSSFSTTVYHLVNNPTDPIEFKVNNECDKYRLVSPNYAGAFEFSETKNGGIHNFEVNCTYKPLQPYIHINPVFGGLYGGDYNDSRGLICGGNFSLPVVNDAWTNYQIQNKSYQEAFDRQIENMEVSYEINRRQTTAAGIINTITSGVSGAAAGFLPGSLAGGVGGAIGAGIGGIAGGVGSAIGLAADLKFAEQLQNEALSFAKDQFNYSLQNIQALPNTMSRTSAFDINNKIFPILEYYTCTDLEKEAFRNKMKYNGMTAMVIDTIANYIQSEPTFIQGQIIRININEDYHLAAAIASEVHRGIYI